MSLKRNLFYSLSPKMRMWVRNIFYMPIDTWDRLSGNRSKYEPPKGKIYIGSGDFMIQGKKQVNHLRNHINLQATDNVLDIGSGIGRTAASLTAYIGTKGKYEGFDVVKSGVDWCNSKIKKDFPNFNFQYIPLKNDLYNTLDGNATSFIFPYPANSFDKVFLFSVFTHMPLPEIENYLKEIYRVLKPSGQCLATFFVYDHNRLQSIGSKSKSFSFPVDKGNYRLMSEKVTAANVAIKESYLHGKVKTIGFVEYKIIKGYWFDNASKNDANDFQDMFILKK